MSQANMTYNIQAGDRTYSIYQFTGKVVDVGKQRSTEVFGGGGGGGSFQGTGATAPVRVSSVTHVHDNFHLVDKEGKERAFEVQNFNVSMREGNIVTIMWSIKSGQEQGPYFAVYNHTTDSKYIKDDIVKAIVNGANSYKHSFTDYLVGVPLGCLVVLLVFAVPFLFIFGIDGKPGYLLILASMVGAYVFLMNKQKERINLFKAAIKFPEVQPW